MTGKTDLDYVIMRAVADELRDARERRKWTRPSLVERLGTGMPVNTYSSYEQAIRPCPIARFVEFCITMEESPGEFLNRALQRAGFDIPDARPKVDVTGIFEAIVAELENQKIPTREREVK